MLEICKKHLLQWGLAIMLYPASPHAELIILMSPVASDDYYRDVTADIIDFHIEYSKAILKHGDDVVILSDPTLAHHYAEHLGKDHIVEMPIPDIWARDFSPSNSESPFAFQYTAAGQGGDQSQADWVQDKLYTLIDAAQLAPYDVDLLNDGGNWVDDGAGNVVISTKFLKDNTLTETEAREILQGLPSIENVAFIEADEQGGLEHSDGVVSFIEPLVALVNQYPEDPDYENQLHRDLRRGIPNIKIIPIVTPYDGSEIYDEKFGSACGLYTNALVTPERIYLPQFGIPEDREALALVRSVTNKTVVPVSSQTVCHMGGGVRCMSWQTRGRQKLKLKAYLDARP